MRVGVGEAVNRKITIRKHKARSAVTGFSLKPDQCCQTSPGVMEDEEPDDRKG